MADELVELEALEAKLFAAARVERATAEVRARVLASAMASARGRSRIRRLQYVSLLAVAASFAALFGLRGRSFVPVGIDREVVSASTGVRNAELPAVEHAHEEPPPPMTTSTASPRASAPRPAASLSEELELLESARSALARGSPEKALGLLATYDATLRGTRLRAEATMLRIEALAAAGRASESARLAEKFVRENPGSPLADRARTFALENDTHSKQEPGGKR